MFKTQPIEKESLVAGVDSVRRVANKKLGGETKSRLGQFMTPASTATFMASLFKESNIPVVELLDPGAGVGSLATAFLARLKEWEHVKSVNLDAFEIDSVMLGFLEKNLETCRAICNQRSFSFGYRIFNKDFIVQASEQIFEAGGLWRKNLKHYTHCIMNPPYKKISSSSFHRKSLRSAGIETVNLYSGFVALALSLLDTGGQLVAIIPRSFCNGPYYRSFRKFVFKHSAIKKIHLFKSRNTAFKDDNVLQENVIVCLEKEGVQDDVELSFSSDDTFSDLTTSLTPFSHVVYPADKELFIHIPSASDNVSCVDEFEIVLSDIGLQVSTGPVVDYRLREHLVQMPDLDSVPLLYPCHFSSMATRWPVKDCKKPNAITINEKTRKWLYPNGYYTVVRRFSSKEEKRRIVASVVSPEDFKDKKFIGFENHLNVFHFNRQGLPENLARGLAVYLNCKAVDENFRRFSGHTQVNATDLRMMKYPDRKTLIRLGEWVNTQDELVMDEFDKHLEEVVNEPS